MESEHPDPIITCPFCKTVLFCDMTDLTYMKIVEVYDTCENNNCRSRFKQATFKNYVIGYEFYISKFCVQLKYKIPHILINYKISQQKDEIIVFDWYGVKIFDVECLFIPNFSDLKAIEERINKFVSFA